MIEFTSQTKFELTELQQRALWIDKVIMTNGFKVGDISYVFCDDAQLLKINQEF